MRAETRRGFALTAVRAPAVSVAFPPFATGPAGSFVLTVISE